MKLLRGGTGMENRGGNAAMPDSHETGRALKLALLVGLAAKSPAADSLRPSSPAARSPKGFGGAGGAVGLGILAAMSGGSSAGVPRALRPLAPVQSRSDPIPIDQAGLAAETKAAEKEREISESYTCVTSHVGGGLVRKRVYFDEGSDDAGGKYGKTPAALQPVAEEFLSRCTLCRKKLSGLDIFMYRGDRAFCSVECRCEQIRNDEHTDKRRMEAKKSTYSESPRSVTHVFRLGVAAS